MGVTRAVRARPSRLKETTRSIVHEHFHGVRRTRLGMDREGKGLKLA